MNIFKDYSKRLQKLRLYIDTKRQKSRNTTQYIVVFKKIVLKSYKIIKKWFVISFNLPKKTL